ncbi:MAG: flavodoxin domain-containing protein [Sedimenticolaceae bacterium]|nr:flavodoxin domain-containing protein [Sedimenticolaceae bacterium]
MRILIAYASLEGQSEKIAHRIGETLEHSGAEPLYVNTREHPEAPWPRDCNGLIAGGPLHREHHPQELGQWLENHRSDWAELPTAFFSVSLSAASDRQQDLDDAQRVMQEFLDEIGMDPDMTATIAGALKYSRYGFFKKRIMRNIVKKSGGKELDMSRDYEYTDWNQVDRFATEFLASIARK